MVSTPPGSGALILFALSKALSRFAPALLTLAVVWTALALALDRDKRRGDPWARRLFGAATPDALAAIRVVVVAIVTMMVLREDLPSTASLPASMLDVGEKSFLSLLSSRPAYRAFLASAPALTAFRVGLLVALTMALVGFRTRVTLPVSAIGYLVYGGILRQYTHFFHQGLLPLYLLAALSFTPCADAWSVDRRLREKRGLPVPPLDVPTAVYGQARWAVYALMGLCYFSSGLAKVHVGGPLWWASVNQRTKLLAFAMESRLGLSTSMWIGRLPAWVFAALGLAALVVELGMISVLWSPRSRLLLAPLLSCFHVGVVIAYQIVFPDLIVLPLVLCQPQHLAKALLAAPRSRREALGHLRAVLRDSGFSSSTEPSPSAEVPLETASPAPAKAAATARKPPYLLVAIAAYLPCIVFMIESYPVTSWPMLSTRVLTPELNYMVLQERRSDGSLHPTEPGDEVGAMTDHRYADTLEEYFERGDAVTKTRMDDFFGAITKLHNARVPADQKIAGIVVEYRHWDWGASLEDPGKSRLLQVYRFDVSP